MKRETLIAAAAVVALAATGVLGFAWASSRGQSRRVDCCLDPTCPPGCSMTCPPDCDSPGAPRAKSTMPAQKPAEAKAKTCPPCPWCP